MAKLSPAARILVWVQFLFNLAMGLAGIFVNAFLWKTNHSIAAVARFNLVGFFVAMIAFQAAAWFTKRYRSSVSLSVGMGFYAGFYLLLLVTGEQAGRWLVPLGLLYGVGMACYWAALHTLTYDLTGDEGRDYFYGISGFFNTVAVTVAPLASGQLLDAISGVQGYRLIFGLTLANFIATMLVSRLIRDRGSDRDYRWREVWLPARPNPLWRRIMWAHLFLGVRDGMFSWITLLLLFMYTGGELAFGRVNSVLSLTGLLAYQLVGRFLNPGNRRAALTGGTLAHLLVTVFMAVFLNVYGVVIYAFFAIALVVVWSVPLASLSFEAIESQGEGPRLRIEYIAAREIPLGIGRVITIGTFLLLAARFGEIDVLRWHLPVVAGLLVVGSWLVR